MILGKVENQKLAIAHDLIVSDTIDYLTAQFTFSEDWGGYSATAVFSKDDKSYAIILENGEINAEKHLNLESGNWELSLYGVKDGSRITTNVVDLHVKRTGKLSGTEPESVPPTVAEQVMEKADNAVKIAESVEARANAGEFNGKDGAPGLTGAKGDRGEKGDPGEKGEPGEQGIPGQAGFSPEISVSPIPDGNKVTILDKNGEKDFNVLNGKKGDKGDKGDAGPAGGIGPEGKPGKTPVKGVDYFTEEEISQIESNAAQKVKVPTKLSQLADDAEHRTVTDAEKEKWNAGGSGGTTDYNLLSNKPSINNVELKDNITTEQLGIKDGVTPVKGVDYFTPSEISEIESKAAEKVKVPTKISELSDDPTHRVVTDSQISDWNGKQPAGDYATNESLSKKLDKENIGAATDKDTQEVHLAPDGKLLTAPSGGGGSSYTLPVASSITLGGVKPVAKTDEMNMPVGVNPDGELFTAQPAPPIMPTIIVTVSSDAKITVTGAGKSQTKSSVNNRAEFEVSAFGEYTVSATSSGGEVLPVTIGVYSSHAYFVNLKTKTGIYGVQWDGTANTKWARTDDAETFVDPNPAVSNGTGSSPFDTIMPWRGMQKSVNPEAGEVVSIPKFWYKWTAVGDGLKLQIADKPTPGFFVSPAHMDRGDGKGERDIVYVGRYPCGADYKSTAKAMPKTDVLVNDFKKNIHNLGENVWLYDFSSLFTIQMLYLVEFADWNSQKCIGVGCGKSGTEITGSTDSINYHTGSATSRNELGVGIQYRWIESPWSNVGQTLGGLFYFADKSVNIYLNPIDDLKNNSNYVNMGFIRGYAENPLPSKFSINNDSDNKIQIIIPESFTASLQPETYSCDSWYATGGDKIVVINGGDSGEWARTHYKEYGLFLMNSGDYYSYKRPWNGARLMILP